VTGRTTVTLGWVMAQGIWGPEDAPETIAVLALELVEQGCSFIRLTHPTDDGADFKIGVAFLVDLHDIAVGLRASTKERKDICGRTWADMVNVGDRNKDMIAVNGRCNKLSSPATAGNTE
jgi:hypothetical protein